MHVQNIADAENAQITVSRDGKEVTNAKVSAAGDKVEVVVPSLTSSEGGQYSLTAANEAGSTTKKLSSNP